MVSRKPSWVRDATRGVSIVVLLTGVVIAAATVIAALAVWLVG